jgi:hypothetical protein
MAGRGPVPKPDAQRVRRNKPRVDATEIVADEQLRGPELPESIDWPAATRDWWSTWRTSPLTQTWTPTDWDFLLDTAVLHAEFWSGNLAVAAELRLRVAKFGATPEDRARLKVTIKTPDVATPAKTTPATRKASTARRSRVLRIVDGEAV